MEEGIVFFYVGLGVRVGRGGCGSGFMCRYFRVWGWFCWYCYFVLRFCSGGGRSRIILDI